MRFTRIGFLVNRLYNKGCPQIPIRREGVWYRPQPGNSVIDPAAGQTGILRPGDGSDRFVYRGGNIWRWENKQGRWEEYYFDEAKLDGVYDFNGDFDAAKGYLTAYGDRHGTIAKMIHTPSADGTLPQITGIADRNDRQVYWIEEADAGSGRRLVTIRDLAGRRIQYELSHWTGAGQGTDPAAPVQVLLHRVVDAENHETSMTYEQVNNFKWSQSGASSPQTAAMPARMALAGVTDAAGRQKSIDYMSTGAVASVLDQDGQGFHYEYSYEENNRYYYAMIRDTNGKVKEVWTDADGEARRVDLNGRTVKSFTKDSYTNTHTITDEIGRTTAKRYDQWDNLVEVTHPDGASVGYAYHPTFRKVTRKSDENQVVTAYEYNTDGRLIRRTEARGTTDERVTEFGYDADGNLETIRRPADADTAEALTTMAYDADGNMTTLTDPEGKVTRFTAYDAMGNVLTRIDPLGKSWSYTYDNNGRLRTVTDPLLHVTEYVYDEVGNRKKVIDPENKVTEYEYDPRDNLERMTNPELEVTQFQSTFDGRILKQTDGENRVTRYEYDTDGRLIRNIDGNANTIALSYDETATGCTTCGGGSTDQPSVIEFPTFTRQIRYDLRGRKSAQRDLNGAVEHVTRFTYDAAGNLIQKTDAEGKVTSYEYDPLNRLAKVTDADNRETVYQYDNRDNLIALTDAENRTTRFEYDRNNRLVKEIRPLLQETAYDYDAAGNLIEKIDPKNQRTEYVYDAAGRLDLIRYYAAGDHAAAVKTVDFTYDRSGNLTGYDDGITSAVYTYDDAYRKTGETVTYPGFSLTSAYTYYDNGLKQSYTGPDNITYGFIYDSNNQLTGIQIPDVGMFTVNAYRWNRPAVETLPGGAQRLYSYDDLMRVADITAKDPAGNDQLNYAYTYDRVDNITTKATGHGDYAYSYDDLYRLTDADNPAGQSDEAFTYDGVGNRLTAADTTGDWGYNDNNELEGYDDVSFQYDANGNMTEKSVGGVVTRFFYNPEDRLERVEDGSGGVIAEYYYDPFGRRLWKDVGGTRTCFHYSDEGLVGEYDGAGGEIKSYGWKPGSTWSTDPLFMKIGSEYYWYHNDQLGTPQVMTTTSGAVVWSAKYSSFLEATVDASSTITNNLRAPGQYFDAETGLHWNFHRYYDPTHGRYLRADPIGLEGGLNLYAYVEGNPINLFDPLGNEPCCSPSAQQLCDGYCKNKGGTADCKEGNHPYKGKYTACLCKDDYCDGLRERVQKAKKKVQSFGRGQAACRRGMSKWQLRRRKAAWLELATARATRDNVCYGGGDTGHQWAQADAWAHVGRCDNLLKE